MLLLVGFLAGPIWDSGYGRTLIFVGACLTALGYFMVSICDQYWQVMLAQGILTGFGSGFLYLPCTAIIPQYFDKNKAIANGIAASGSSLGELELTLQDKLPTSEVLFRWCDIPNRLPTAASKTILRLVSSSPSLHHASD